jgi:hypothetical protein
MNSEPYRSLLSALALAAALVASPAHASFHTFQIQEIFSNADGTVQYVVLHESLGMNGENFLSGHTLTVTQGMNTQTYVFTNDLGVVSDGYGNMSTPTANTHVLIATAGFAALHIVTPDYIIPNGFILPSGTMNYAGVDQVTYGSLPTDGVTAIDRNSMLIPNVATNFAGASASVTAAASANYEGLWWASPAASESGWGINFAHQGDTIFASWFTYDLTGKGWWLVMTAPKTAPNTYSGTLYTTTGPAFNTLPFNPNAVLATAVGSGTLTFSDANNASFSYTVNGISQVKALTHQVFGTLPSCATAASAASLAAATNYQDLWWAAPAGSEAGWGINLTHQSDTLFASWFTYDVDHSPMWLVATAPKTAPGVYTGTLYRTTGPAFNATPFNPNAVVSTAMGSATFSFSDGNNASFAYTVNGVSQVKPITREIFSGTGTVCQ